MNNIIREILASISTMIATEDFKSEHRLNKQDFTRNRIIGFYSLVVGQIKGFIKSLSVELNNMLVSFKNEGVYSKQAFSEARQKLRHSAFIALNTNFMQRYYACPNNYKTFRDKYVLLAIDGSLCQLSQSESAIAHFGTSSNQTDKQMAMGKASVMYDVLNHIVVDSQLAHYKQDEHSLYDLHRASEINYFSNEISKIYLMDRNYPSFKKMLELNQQGDFFVIRCKGQHCRETAAFVSLNIQEQTLHIDLSDSTRRNGASLKKVKDCPDSLEVRIVRILLASGEYEYLLTNTDFDIVTLYYLYGLRWGIETFYGGIKGTMQLENFSSTLPEGILQDFHAKILSSNLMQLFIEEAQKRVDKESLTTNNKYKYIINTNVARGLLKDRVAILVFNNEMTPEVIEELINLVTKYKVAVVPDRKPPRNKEKRKSRRKYFMHQKKAF